MTVLRTKVKNDNFVVIHYWLFIKIIDSNNPTKSTRLLEREIIEFLVFLKNKEIGQSKSRSKMIAQLVRMPVMNPILEVFRCVLAFQVLLRSQSPFLVCNKHSLDHK